MMHAAETIERIRAQLIKSGVPKGDVLDEMLDHYLSDIEKQVHLGINPEIALLSIRQKIDKTDLRSLRKSKTSTLLLVALPMIILGAFLYSHKYAPEKGQLIWEEKLVETEPDGWPLIEYVTISSNYGLRKHPILKTLKHHNGIDIKAKIGTPVLATGAAVVKKIGFNKKTGNFIILQHNPRFSTIYCHLSEINVREHETVAKGNIIGKVGNTGMSTAPHLHYEIKDGDAHIDPLECTRV